MRLLVDKFDIVHVQDVHVDDVAMTNLARSQSETHRCLINPHASSDAGGVVAFVWRRLVEDALEIRQHRLEGAWLVCLECICTFRDLACAVSCICKEFDPCM